MIFSGSNIAVLINWADMFESNDFNIVIMGTK